MLGVGRPVYGAHMRSTVPPLPALHAYEAAARLGSFAAAAVELHLSPSAVSQRVRTLEAHLGVALFERLARSVRLTEMGQAYLPTVRRLFEDLSVATTGLFGSATRQRLTVRAQISYAATYLAPRLPHFCAEYPHIDLRLVSAIWADALPPDAVDLEIRHGSGQWVGFRSHLLHTDHAVIVCGPAHRERHGPVRRPADLARRPRIHVLGFEDLWQLVLREDDPIDGDGGVVVTLDTSVSALELAAAGEHCAVIPERYARDAISAGRVAVAWDARIPMRQAHYLLRREGGGPPTPEALAFMQWLGDLDDLDDLDTDPTVHEPGG